MNFVLDCSVTMAWCFQDEASKYADQVLDSFQENSAIVPSLWYLEVINVLLMAEKRKRVNECQQISFLNLIKQLPIDTTYLAEDLNSLRLLCKEFGLTAYDGCYLNLALANNLPLATLDEKLRTAVTKAGGEIYLK
jgi:predicted nucleic acid-binding protein